MLVIFAAATMTPREADAETMDAALARAYQGNPQLNAQRAIVRQNDESVAQALSGYRPTLSATASVARQFTNTTGVIPPIPPELPNGISYSIKGYTDPWTVGISGQQTLFNGGRTANQVRHAESQVSAARETLRMMEESILLSAAIVYMDVSRDTANLEVQQNNIRVLQRTLKDTQNRFTAGQVTTTDVAQAEAQLAAGQANLYAAESTLMTTKANYKRIIGVDPANLAPASPVDRLAPTTLNAAVTVGTAENPAISAALYGVDVAQLQVKIAEGALWPTLALQGSFQQQNYPNILTPNLFLGTVMVNLSVPLYQGGAEYSAIRLDKENGRAAAAECGPGPRSDAGERGSGLGPATSGEGTGRSRDPPERSVRTRARRRPQRGASRTAHDARRAQCRTGLGQCARRADCRAARSGRCFI